MHEKILAIQNAPGEHLGFFADILEEQGISFEYSKPYKDDIPPINSYTKLIILGGPMGVYEAERYPFLKREVEYIRAAIKRRMPVLGVCLGAQLMAHALGGRVYPGDEEEKGWYPIKLSEDGKKDEILRNFDSEFQVFHWHGDTFTLPFEAVHLASSQLYKNQAFRFGNSYALQFHLEVTEAMVGEWVLDLGEKEAEEILKPTKKCIAELNDRAENFLKSWLSL
jgi:GMP synthase (glutamine-hydrolysing)